MALSRCVQAVHVGTSCLICTERLNEAPRRRPDDDGGKGYGSRVCSCDHMALQLPLFLYASSAEYIADGS